MCIKLNELLAKRVSAIEVSGIRKVFDLAQSIKNPINLSIGQPHFDVPDNIKDTAIKAIQAGKNAYTQTQGSPELRQAILNKYAEKYVQKQLLITSGVSGALTLAFMALLNPGDELVTSDPYFISYKQLAFLNGAQTLFFNTYPDFKLNITKVAAAITDKTKFLIFSSPANPTGKIYSKEELQSLANLARDKNLLIISDEIYADYSYDTELPRISDYYEQVLVLGGFSKSHAMTGWRLGFALGPAEIISAMTKLQQFTYVCAPSFAQFAGISALQNPLKERIDEYRKKRDFIYNGLLSAGYEVVKPGGAFYIFPRVPWGTDLEFTAEAIRNQLLIIPGSVFSEVDTHFRISYAASDKVLQSGLEILAKLSKK